MLEERRGNSAVTPLFINVDKEFPYCAFSLRAASSVTLLSPAMARSALSLFVVRLSRSVLTEPVAYGAVTEGSSMKTGSIIVEGAFKRRSVISAFVILASEYSPLSK